MRLARLRSRSPKRSRDCSDNAQPCQETNQAGTQTLKGWKQIADFLGHPAAVVLRWTSEGIPVHRVGCFVVAIPADLNAWLGKESGKPVHAATEATDLAAELRRGLSFIRNEKGAKSAKSGPGKPRRR
jgi:hypothetical protein